MNSVVAITVAVFCAVVLGIQAVVWLYSDRKSAADAVNRRLALGNQSNNSKEVFETLRRERGLVALESGRFASFNRFLTQTGLRLNETKLAVMGFALSLALFLLFGLILGFGFRAFALGIICSLICLWLVASIVRQKRIARFAEQLPDALDVIVRGVKAGYPFIVALGLVSKEMPDPIGSEFGLTCDEITFGAQTAKALENLHSRVGEEELTYLAMAIKIQTETGGNLAEILGTLSKLMRDRAMLKLKIRSITAEGRLSAIFLSLVPFILFGVVTLLKPDYYVGVQDSPIAIPAVILGFVLLFIGNLTMYKMVNFKV